jgi:hypothetical protein
VAGALKATDDATAFPPGVFQGSRDHLSHALMNSEGYHFIPPGCPTEYIRPSDAPFQPQFFSNAEFPVVRRLTRLLLGESSDDSPSVQETAEWIDLRAYGSVESRAAAKLLHPLHRSLAIAYQGHAHVDSISSEGPAGICRQGLEWIAGRNFMSLGITEQTDLLHSMSDERRGKQNENEGTRLFDFLKTETIKGFYTSRAGLKELDFKGNAFYARSPGCSS